MQTMMLEKLKSLFEHPLFDNWRVNIGQSRGKLKRVNLWVSLQFIHQRGMRKAIFFTAIIGPVFLILFI